MSDPRTKYPNRLHYERKILHEGEEHRLIFKRMAGVSGWSVSLDGKPWAIGKRIKQGEWIVTAGETEQRGRTLDTTASSLFYNLKRGDGLCLSRPLKPLSW